MATATKFNVDLNSVFANAQQQFRGLNPNEPGQWPLLPKLATFAAVAAAVVALGWFLVLTDKHDELEAERNREPGLRADYRAKLAQAMASAFCPPVVWISRSALARATPPCSRSQMAPASRTAGKPAVNV